MSATLPTGVGSPDDWTFWHLIYNDPDLVRYDLPPEFDRRELSPDHTTRHATNGIKVRNSGMPLPR